jgi:hypothetical protein
MLTIRLGPGFKGEQLGSHNLSACFHIQQRIAPCPISFFDPPPNGVEEAMPYEFDPED